MLLLSFAEAMGTSDYTSGIRSHPTIKREKGFALHVKHQHVSIKRMACGSNAHLSA
jgi:hypothetical protein